MNISLEASYERRFRDLWAEYQRNLPGRPGQFRIIVDPPMAGPDANGDVTFCRVPDEFLGPLKKSRLPYRMN
jgi:hypothetical protein